VDRIHKIHSIALTINMLYRSILYLLFVVLVHSLPVCAQDTLMFKGQVSIWGNINPSNDLPVWLSGRAIPVFQFQTKLKKNRTIDFEGSANIYGSIGSHPFDSVYSDGKIKPYRAWARYSTSQLELRVGLQKINFGQAVMLRPLMWFDQLDPRDPLQITDGVWGMLGRYYFMNNANLWLWCLYGNEKVRTWEIGETIQKMPEFGGRFQMPVKKGEAAISYHFREADTSELQGNVTTLSQVPENWIGLDAKWDLGVGLWFEGTWINKGKPSGKLTNQEIMTTGIDYTFGMGNGLNVVYEQMVMAMNDKAFDFADASVLSAMSVNYPLGLSDHLSSIVYYDWKNQNLYNFVNWKHQFKNYYLYLMAYSNPKYFNLPQQSGAGTLYSGKGFQIMLVYNY